MVHREHNHNGIRSSHNHHKLHLHHKRQAADSASAAAPAVVTSTLSVVQQVNVDGSGSTVSVETLLANSLGVMAPTGLSVVSDEPSATPSGTAASTSESPSPASAPAVAPSTATSQADPVSIASFSSASGLSQSLSTSQLMLLTPTASSNFASSTAMAPTGGNSTSIALSSSSALSASPLANSTSMPSMFSNQTMSSSSTGFSSSSGSSYTTFATSSSGSSASATASLSEYTTSDSPTTGASFTSTGAGPGVGAGGAATVSPSGTSTSTAGSDTVGGNNGNANDSAPSTGAIAGGVVGGVAGFSFLILLAFMFMRWKRKNQSRLLLGNGADARTDRAVSDAAHPPIAPAVAPAPVMTEQRIFPFAIPAALASLTGHKRKSTQQSIPSSTASERGFYRVSGRKITSVLQSGGDGYGEGDGPSEGRAMSSGGSFYRDSRGFDGRSGAPPPILTGPLATAIPGSPRPRDSVTPVSRQGPARTPIISRSPFADPEPNSPDTITTPPPLRRPDALGRSHASQDGSHTSNHTSRFVEDV